MKIFSQTNKKQPSLFFDQWAENSEIKDEEGKSKPLYHGTLSDFKQFDIDKANPDNFLGKGIYLTDDPWDSNQNYATPEGADFRNKLYNKQEEIENEIELTPDYKKYIEQKYNVKNDDFFWAIREEAKEALGAGNPRSMPVYLKMKNPLHLSPHSREYFNVDIDEETGEEDEESSGSQLLQKFTDFCYDVGLDGDSIKTAMAEALDDLLFDGFNYQDFFKAFKLVASSRQYGPAILELTDNKPNNLFADFVKYLNHDGIIMDANHEFPRMNLNPYTRHYVAFDPGQIKSSIGNSGVYDPQSYDITARTVKKLIKCCQLDQKGLYSNSDQLQLSCGTEKLKPKKN